MSSASRFTSSVATLIACAVLAGASGLAREPSREAARPQVGERQRPGPATPEAPPEAPIVLELELEDAENGRHGRLASAATPSSVAVAAARPGGEREHRIPLRREPGPSVAGHGARSPPV